MPTFSYRCPEHGLFDVLGLPSPHPSTNPCPDCGAPAGHEYSPGSWSVPQTGIFKEHYSWSLGARVSSNRGMAEVAKRQGLIHRQDVSVKGKKSFPSAEEVATAWHSLRAEDVRRAEETRLRLEWEERNGQKSKAPRDLLPARPSQTPEPLQGADHV